MTQTLLETVMLLHGLFAASAFLSSIITMSIVYSGRLREKSLSRLRAFSLLTVISLLAVNITGLYGYISYRLPNPDSPRSIILMTWPLAHEVLFETMEYLGLIGPVWSALVAWLIWHYKGKIVEEPGLRRAVLVIMLLGFLMILGLSYAGLIPTMITPVR